MTRDEGEIFDRTNDMLQDTLKFIRLPVEKTRYYVLVHNGMIHGFKPHNCLTSAYNSLLSRVADSIRYWLYKLNPLGLPRVRSALRRRLQVLWLKYFIDENSYTIHYFQWNAGVGEEIPLLEVIKLCDNDTYEDLMKLYEQGTCS